MTDVKPIPDGYPVVSPYLCVDGATAAIQFYGEVLGATERMRMPAPGGKVGHAELQIGDSLIMVSDPFPQGRTRSPKELGGTTGGVFLYVEDVDSAFQQAIDAGATVTMPVEDQFWGDRFGSLMDPYGHSWSLATHTEDLSEEEIAERSQAAMAAMSA